MIGSVATGWMRVRHVSADRDTNGDAGLSCTVLLMQGMGAWHEPTGAPCYVHLCWMQPSSHPPTHPHTHARTRARMHTQRDTQHKQSNIQRRNL